jgi:hypothetical protein
MELREMPVLVENLERGYEPETAMDTEAGVTPLDSEELREWARVRQKLEGVWHGCAESNHIGF